MSWIIKRDKKKTDEYLMHYGIKGQKWGERNYQYEDGSYTPAGKERYRDRVAKAASRVGSALSGIVNKAVSGGSDNKASKDVTSARASAKKKAGELERKRNGEKVSEAAFIAEKCARENMAKGSEVVSNKNTKEAAYTLLEGLGLSSLGDFDDDDVAVVRVGHEYLTGNQRELKDLLEVCIGIGMNVRDSEIISVYNHDLSDEPIDKEMINKDIEEDEKRRKEIAEKEPPVTGESLYSPINQDKKQNETNKSSSQKEAEANQWEADYQSLSDEIARSRKTNIENGKSTKKNKKNTVDMKQSDASSKWYISRG